MTVNQNDLDQIKRIPIADIVAASGLTIVKRGGGCLSTKEHSSLILFVRSNSWYWFSRGVGGDVIDWLKETQGLCFEDACEWLLNRPLRQSFVLQPVKVDDELPPAPLPQGLHTKMQAAMQAADVEWWLEQGIGIDAQWHFVLGVYQHPTWGKCYSIPVLEGGRLVNIRLRLASPPKPHDKYRPYDTGRGTHLFNADALTEEVKGVVIVAGEKKVIVLWQYGIPAVSPTAGCGHWRPEWTATLQFCKVVYVAYDPGEEAAAERMATTIGARARIVTLPDKPDDFILREGESAFRYHLKHALKLADWRKEQRVSVPEVVAEALYDTPAPVAPHSAADVPWRRQLYQAK